MKGGRSRTCVVSVFGLWPNQGTFLHTALQADERQFEDDLVKFLEATGEERLAKNVRGRHIAWYCPSSECLI